MKKIVGMLLLVVLGLAVAAGCASAAKDTLTIAVTMEPVSMNPTEVVLQWNDIFLRCLYDNLIYARDDGAYVPWLAESYEMLSDTQWKFVLRSGATFSDGSPVTAADCAASIKMVHDSPAMSAYASWLDHVEVIDELNFVIHTTAPSERVLLDLANYNMVVPAKLIEQDYDFNKNPIGSGPYTMVEWKAGDRVTFKARDDYWNKEYRSKIPNLIVRIMPEGISRTIALENGEVDFVWDVNPTDLPSLEANPDITISNRNFVAPFYLAFNLKKEHVNNINVRKAIACAVNRDNATQIATGGYSRTINSAFIPGVLGSTEAYAEGYNLEKAKEYMAASGVTGPIELTAVVRVEAYRLALESVQADLREIGIDLKIEMVDAATFTARGADGDFDILAGMWGTPDLLLYAQVAFATGGSTNYAFISDPEIDRLINEGLQTFDEKARAGIIDQIIKICDGNVYRIGIYQLTAIRAYNAKLAGYETNVQCFDLWSTLYWNE